MRLSDGMLERHISLKTVLLLAIVIIPFVLSGVTASQSVSTNTASLSGSSVNGVLIAGGFQYFDVTYTDEVDKICIIAYQGDFIPEPDDRTVSNYYRWDYEKGVWKDTSGHNSIYIKPSQCVKNDDKYSFYIGIDKKANPGHWSIKILVDDEEVESSNSSIVVVAQFHFFLSSLIGIYEPSLRDKNPCIHIDFICNDRKKIMVESKENIDDLVDEVLSKNSETEKEKYKEEIDDLCFFENSSSLKNESVKSTVYTYPRSKLKTYRSNTAKSLFFNKKMGGGNVYWSTKSGNYRRVLTLILAIVLLSVAFVPIINPQDTKSPSSPIISSFIVDPEMVNLGDFLLLNVSASDSVGINSVIADIGGFETVNLSFVEGTVVNDTIYPGLWQSTYLVKDIDPGNYTAIVVALNKNNDSVSKQRFFKVLPVDDENISINDTIEPKYNESVNLNQTGEQNYTTPYGNDTINGDLLNKTVDQNTIYTSISNMTTNEIIPINQTDSTVNNKSSVFIVDKKHEQLSVLPGTRFYVERTIDGPHGTNVVFVPMYSDALTLESIEVVENKDKDVKTNTISHWCSGSDVFDAGKQKCKKELEIEQLRDKLPHEIKALNKIAYTDNVELQSPRTIRLWFLAPSWEEIQSNSKPSSGEISYLVFTDGDYSNFDFEGSTWWDSTWSYRKLITINSSQVDGDLVNFPVFIYEASDSDLANHAQDDGDDIAFVLWSDNTTQLNHEIELFDNTTGELAAWVNVTSLSSSVDTMIWMYYNNSASGNQQNVNDTWDSNYVVVIHFKEGVDGTAQDSTIWDNDATPGNGGGGGGADPDQTVSGYIGYGVEFNGVSLGNYMDIADDTELEITGDLSITAWLNWDGHTNSYDYWCARNYASPSEWACYFTDAAGSMRTARDSTTETSGQDFGVGAWRFIGFVDDGIEWTYYRNTARDTDTRHDGSASTYPIRLGGRADGASLRNWDGTMDEIRISNIGRSQTWLSTSYNTTSSPSTFLSFGYEENVTDTSVDPISPYNITYSPFTITATGASGLDNVTLWHRYAPDNSSWDDWIEDTIDSLSPWSWDFNFPNGTGYYEFYSIGKKSGLPDETAPGIADAICYFNESMNTPPFINLIYPSPNGATDVSIIPTCQIWANDSEGDTLTVYWYENTTGSFVLRNTNNSITANSTVSFSFSQFSNYSTTYWWKVEVNDTIDNTSTIFYFTTEPIDTSVDGIVPYTVTSSPKTLTATGSSDLDNVKLFYRWSSDNVSWGTKTISIFEGFESGSQNTSLWGLYQTAGDTRTQFNYGTAQSGSYSCAMDDDDTDTGDFELNEIYTVYDFTKAMDINIEFWHSDADDEPNPSPASWVDHGNYDAVSFTNDGTTWYELFDTDTSPDLSDNSGSIVWEYFTYNVSSHPNFNPSVGSNFAIKFQQYDNYHIDPGAASDGRLWDNIYINFTIPNDNGTDWREWSNASNPDPESPWSWNFDFPNSSGYYEFYSIGNKSGSPNETAPSSADAICYYNPLGIPPTITLINPSPNGTTGVSLQPNCQIQADDANDDTLTVYWYENTTGSWILRNTNNSVSAGSIISYSFTEFSNYSTTYWWKVAVNDSSWNTSDIFYFTTESLDTYVNTITPYTITTSPKTITVTNITPVDEVILYYRWSDDNSTWWNSAWTYRENITISSSLIDSDLTNFPILVNITSNNLSSKAQSDGDDIVFTNASGTKLNHEIENYTSSNGKLIAWVNVTSVSSSLDTTIFMYYGNSNCDNQENAAGTWDSNYVMVQHLNETSGTHYDSTSNNVDGTWVGDSDGTQDTLGIVDLANDFHRDSPTDGDYLSFGIHSVLDITSALTLETWIRTTSSQDFEYFIAKRYDGTEPNAYTLGKVAAGNARFYYAPTNSVDSTDTDYADGSWKYSVITVSGTSYNFYKNGGSDGSGSLANVLQTNSYPLRIACRYGGPGATNYHYEGFLDEVRISKTSRAAGWISATYNTIINSSTFLSLNGEESWTKWDNPSNPDTESPWSWNFDFPNSTGYYEFYSIGNKSGSPNEPAPSTADAICYYKPSINYPIINSYDLRNSTGSKLNNVSGLLDINDEYFFSINITDSDGWMDINYINITAWYDQGSEATIYNQTLGGNLNMFLQYENITGTANFRLLWPDDEAQLILGNCSEKIYDANTRIINISFIPLSQIRWASSNGSWDPAQNTTNDDYSWNFNISVTDTVNFTSWIRDEYGVYKFTSISPAQDWVDVNAAPGFSDTSNIVTITYSSNYNFNMSIYFEENLTNTSRGDSISIANNVDILAAADPNDDITTDITFLGIDEVNAVDIFNDSGIFSTDNVSQTVNVQFSVYIPLATLGGRYSARVATKIVQD